MPQELTARQDRPCALPLVAEPPACPSTCGCSSRENRPSASLMQLSNVSLMLSSSASHLTNLTCRSHLHPWALAETPTVVVRSGLTGGHPRPKERTSARIFAASAHAATALVEGPPLPGEVACLANEDSGLLLTHAPRMSTGGWSTHGPRGELRILDAQKRRLKRWTNSSRYCRRRCGRTAPW